MIRKRTGKIQKRSRLSLPLLLLLLLWAVPLLAATLLTGASASANDELPDLNRTGSITLTLTDDDTGAAIPGGTIAIWKVADLVWGDTAYEWQYTEDFSDCSESLDYLESIELVDTLVNYAQEKALDAAEIVVDAQGTAIYDGISVGLYLAVQTQVAAGYEPFLPFLVSVPCETASGWTYDVDASPKIEPITETAPETQPVTEVETDPATEAVTEPTSESEAGREKESETTGETESEPQSESERITESETKTETEIETEPANETERITENETENETKDETENTTESGTEGKSGTETEKETEAVSETLPQTGRLLWPIPVLAGVGILFFVVGRLLNSADKR